MAVNTSRLWVMVEQMIGTPRWRAKLGTLAGCVIDEPNDMRRFVEVMQGETRDVLIVTPEELLIVRPKPVAKLGLLAGLRAARGNTSKLGDLDTIPRTSVASFALRDGLPGRITSTPGTFLTAEVDVRDAAGMHKIVFVVDPHIVHPGDIEQNVAAWLANR